MTYRVRDWNELYETSTTRKRKQLGWVLVPNRHDSLGYNQIISLENGLEVFAAWVLILQVASRTNPRGVLISDTGNPYTSRDIAAKTRAPESKIRAALDVLVDVGWLETDGQSANKVADRANKVADRANKVADDANEVADDANEVAQLMPTFRHEERKKERKKESPPYPPAGGGDGGGDDSLLMNDPAFASMWRVWLNHCKGKPGGGLTVEAQRAQLLELEQSTPKEAIGRLQLAITRNWQSPARSESRPPSRRCDDLDLNAAKVAEIERLAKA